MKKIAIILSMFLCAQFVQAQFPTNDSAQRFTNKWIRNSPIDAFTNLRLNTVLIYALRQIDSTQILSFAAVNDSTIRLITKGKDTFTVTVRGVGGSGSPNSNIGSGFRVAVAGTNNVKTLFVNNTLSLDSSSNTNGLTFKVDTAKISTVRGLKDSMYRALNSMPMTSKIEFVQSGDATTYQDDDLIGKYILLVSGEGYIYGTVTRSSGYYSFDAGTGTITIHNSQFSDDDYVLILYRTTPIYVTDGSGNYVVDGNGNYIIAN